MKKFICLSLALVMCLLVCVSCSSKKNDLKFGKELLAVESQLDALNGLVKGDADLAIIDSVMAGYYLNKVDTFKDYQVLDNAQLAKEQYAIAAKKGNEALMGKVNEALIALAETDAKTIATTYGLATELLLKADAENPLKDAKDESWNKIVEAKKVVIGYTLYAPIAYKDGDGADAKLIGFDVDLARAVVAYLNKTYNTAVEVEFIKIEWDSKETLLENGSIDLVWNGLTTTPEREAAMTMSIPYMANNQVAIVKKADAEKFACTDYDSFVKAVKGAVVIVEKGSAGESLVKPVD